MKPHNLYIIILLTLFFMIGLSKLNRAQNSLQDSKSKKKYVHEKGRFIECYDFNLKNVDKRNFSSLSDTIIGNWQFFDDRISNYYETLFLNDSVYTYNTASGKSPNLSYKVSDGYLVITWLDGNKNYSLINIIDFNTIQLTGSDTIFFGDGDSKIENTNVVMHRIPDNEFTFSDIKCWKHIATKKGLRYSHDVGKYHRDFRKREKQFLDKNAL